MVQQYKINRPCNCIVTPTFVGELLVTSREVAVYSCNTGKNVQNSIIFSCPIEMSSSETIKVLLNQSMEVRAGYVSPSIPRTFYHSLKFQQKGMIVYLSIFGKINCSFRYVVL